MVALTTLPAIRASAEEDAQDNNVLVMVSQMTDDNPDNDSVTHSLTDSVTVNVRCWMRIYRTFTSR